MLLKELLEIIPPVQDFRLIATWEKKEGQVIGTFVRNNLGVQPYLNNKIEHLLAEKEDCYDSDLTYLRIYLGKE